MNNIDPQKIRYFICNTSHPRYNQAIVSFEAMQKAVLPDNILSVVPSVSGTKSLVKVAGFTGETIPGVVLTWHLRANLPVLRNMLQTPEWFIDE